MDNTKYVTTIEASKLLNIHPSSIKRWAQSMTKNQNNDYIIKEARPSGSRWKINKEYLLKNFPSSMSSSKQSAGQPIEFTKIIEILNKRLDQQDKIIEQLNEHIAEQIKITQTILLSFKK